MSNLFLSTYLTPRLKTVKKKNSGNMKKSMLLRVLVVTWLTVYVPFVASTAKAVNSTVDSMALVDLYVSTGGVDWYDHSNWLSSDVPINLWYGVTVDASGRVSSLNLCGNNLTGAIPSSIGNMTALQWLRLCENNLTDTIPATIGELAALERLELYENNLTGSLPPEIGLLINLKMLNLHGNQLTGTLPPEIQGLVNLERLDLYSNQFLGDIPGELGMINGLITINLYDNNFTGVIPVGITGLSHLERLDLGHNQLTGTIPNEIGGLVSLKWLYLNDNLLTGAIPEEIGNILTLQILNLSGNHLEGELPAGIGGLTALRRLLISDNQLTGTLPAEISALVLLDTLDFSGNEFFGCFPLSYSVFCDISRDFTGNPGLPGGGDFDMFCFDLSGGCANVTGQIIQDENANCTQDSEDTGLYRWRVFASNGVDTFLTFSKPSGYYSLNLPVGTYEISAIPPVSYWTLSCDTTTEVTIANETDIHNLDFYASPVVMCARMEVDISTPFVRGCRDATYTVVYDNSGSTVAADATVEVTLSEMMTVVATSIPISAQQDNTYFFSLGNVGISEVGRFQIEVAVSCEVVIGQTLCVDAHIYPDTICEPPPSEWAGDIVKLTGKCAGDSVKFIIENIGEGDMPSPGSFFIIEDAVMLLTGQNEFQLSSGESAVFNYEANGSTYVFQTTQAEYYPGISSPLVAVEGCGINDTGDFSTGFVTQFAEDDGELFVSIDCRETIGAYDPNDKKAYPKGYGDVHYIDVGQELEYHIRFQNTGTDTANTVVVKDVISPYLDISTLQTESGSHDYYVEITGDTLIFVFSHIMLPDSNANEADSHGFLKFKLQQKQDLPTGTVINNTAGIYFDNNEPVMTNTTTHVLGDNYLEVLGINDLHDSPISVWVYPNPSNEGILVRMEGGNTEGGEWSLTDIYGRLIKHGVFTGEFFQLNGEGMVSGTYILQISPHNHATVTAKWVIK